MSPNDGNSYNEQSPDQNASSVFDFLYHDAKRIGAFLSQFETYGLPQSVKAVEKVSESQTTDASVQGAVKIPLIIEGGGGTKWGYSSASEDAAERTYDPLWRNALTFLDYLETHDLIVRSITDAQIGRFVLVSGDLAVFDMEILKAAWENPVISALISKALTGGNIDVDTSEGNRHQRRALQKGGAGRPKSSVEEFKDGILPFIKMLPHSIVSTIQHDGENVWFNLSKEALTVSSTELLLKHGVSVPGTWNVIGILDAYPDEPAHPEFGDLSATVSAATLGSLGVMIAGFAPMIRQVIGRPADAYGVTPLMVFRQVFGTD